MNKLIISINQLGSYKGGAQKRYFELFNYLNNSSDSYFLLLNDSLYYSCINDGILKVSSNLLHMPVKYEVYTKQQTLITNIKNINKNNSSKKKCKLLGRIKYFIKCAYSCLLLGMKLKRVIEKYHIASVYCVFNGGVFLWPWLRFMKIPYIYSYNDTNFSHINKSIIGMFSNEYYALKNAQYIDCLSPYIASGLKKRFPNWDKNKFIVTPNSFIDYSKYQRADIKEDYIVFCSRLVKLKNPLLLLEAINLIKDNLKGYKVVIIGDGPEYRSLLTYININQLNDYVILTGALVSSYDYVSKSKIFVSIQENNNYPSQSLLEAMACENAIIASDVGETRMLVTEEEGILVHLDKEDIAKALKFLIQNSNICSEMGIKAKQKAKLEHTIEKFSEYFNNIMSNI